MRKPLDKGRLEQLFEEIGANAPRKGHFRVYLTGGASAVQQGWRASTLDADLSADRDGVFAGIQDIKETLNLNIEFAKPTDFVPPLPGQEERHVYIDRVGNVEFYHFDPYAQAFAKLVRGFERDLRDVDHMVNAGWVNLDELDRMVLQVPGDIFAKYPSISRAGAVKAIDLYRASGTRRS